MFPEAVAPRAEGGADGGARPQFALERLEIRRMPGFRRQGFTLDGLSEGINVIYGPNGAGKTTTARAIEALLWPNEAFQPGDALFGRFRLGNERWTVELEDTRQVWQRHGRPAERPSFPGELARHRYRLSLTELLHVDDAAFAGQIVRESAGGYDVAEAAQRLGFGQRPGGHQKAGKALEAARQKVERAQREQEQLQQAEQRLAALEAGAAEAAAAAEEAHRLDRWIELAESRAVEAERRRARDAFPPWMEALTGDEIHRLARLEAAQREAEADRQAAERARQQAVELREAQGLPEGGLSLEELHQLRERHQSLEERERECRELQRQLAQAEEALETESRRLGGEVEVGRLATLNREALQTLHQAAAEGQALEEERRSLEAQRARFARAGEGPGDEGPDERRLWQGMDLLSRWLRTPDTTQHAQHRRQALGVALVGVAATLAGLVLGGGALLVGLVAAGAGLALAWGVARWLFAAPEDLRGTLVAQYRALGLPEPAGWSPDGVAGLLADLLEDLARAKEEAYRQARHQELSRQLAEVESRLEGWRQGWEALLAELGLATSLPAADGVWLAERIAAWQSAQGRVEEVRAALLDAEAERDRVMAQQAAALAPYGYAALETREALAGALAGLEARRERWEKARQAEREALQQARAKEAEVRRLRQERQELFQRLGLDGDDPAAEAALRQAVADLERYRALQKAWKEASWRLERAREELAALGLDPDSLPERSLEELRLAQQVARRQADEEQHLREEMVRIQERIRQAKAAHDLEEALAEEDAAREQVLDLFRKEAATTLGAWLAGLVQAHSRESERPQVFHRARELLHTVTKGRYTLELEEGDPPAFRALETATGEGRALDELSSGTRVQLLLAVRVAFVETQEQGARLPLIFDEVLANSDDERAQAVKEAVVALARQGRQIFYFTAQLDEVAKWQAVLEGAGVPFRLLDLEGLKREEAATLRPLPAPGPSRPEPPPPEGLSYAEYGRRLRVPGLSPHHDAPGQVHLWHLLDDGEDLYRLLSLGLERWGQLQALGEAGLEAMLPGRGRRLHQKAQAAARVLAAVVEAWRVGRGRPVDRGVLAASGAVSERFLDGASRLAQRVGGDARQLVEALAAGELRHFRQDKLEQLRSFLRDEGYLDEREPLAPERLSSYALVAAAPALGSGLLTREHVDRLVAAVVGAEG